MKFRKILNLSMVAIATLTMTSCFEETEFTGPIVPVSLTIVVDDAAEAAVSGATVELYSTLDDYISEVNAVTTATTDANGKVTFDAAILGAESTKFYFNVISGTKRNWNYTSSTAVMNLTNGATIIPTIVDDLPPGFIYLTSNRFVLTGYSYAGTPFVLGDNVLPVCENGDIIEFKKDGSVWRFDATTKCASPSSFQLELYDLNEKAWSTWGLSEDGSEITIRDLDPFWDSSDVEVDAAIQIDEGAGTVIIGYGGPYNAALDQL